MDKYSAMVAFTGIISGMIVISVIVTSIARAAVAHKRAGTLPDATAARIEERLSRIEQAVDAIAVEVERVSEGQRFTTKLLSERTAEHA